MVVCGCCHTDIEDFARRVKETHGDNQHARDYERAIQMAKIWIGLEGDIDEQKNKSPHQTDAVAAVPVHYNYRHYIRARSFTPSAADRRSSVCSGRYDADRRMDGTQRRKGQVKQDEIERFDRRV